MIDLWKMNIFMLSKRGRRRAGVKDR